MSFRYLKYAVALCVVAQPLSSLHSQDLLHSYDHGTVVFTIWGADGIVMAADGQQIEVGRKGHQTGRKVHVQKIFKCGTSFLCGGAGEYPMDTVSNDGRVRIEYDFEKVLILKQIRDATSVKGAADAIDAQLRQIFFGKEKALTDIGFWTTKEANGPPYLEEIAVAGMPTGVPEYCEVKIGFDLANRKLLFNPPECKPSGPFVRSHHLLSGHKQLMDAAMTGKGSAYDQYMPIYNNALATVGTFFPEALPPLRDPIARAVGIVGIHAKVYPDEFGTQTFVGIIVNSKTPRVFLHWR